MKKALCAWLLLGLPAFSQNPASVSPAPDQLQITSLSAIPFDHAQLLFGQQQYPAALTEYSHVIRDYPNDPRREEALYKIAECYRLLSQSTDALAAYRFQAQAYPDGPFAPVVQLRIGELLVLQKKYPDAIPALNQAQAKGDAPVRAAAQYPLALCLLETDKVDDGQKLLLSLTDPATNPAALPYAAAATQALAASYEKQGRLADSLTYWKKLLTLAPGNRVQSQAAARAGYLSLQLGNAKDAEALFETSRQVDSSSEWRRVANTGLLRLYFEQSRWGDVVKLDNAERTVFLESARGDILYQVAHAQFELKSWPDAESAFAAFLKDFPQHPLAPTAAYERLIARSMLDPANLTGDTATYLATYPDSPHVPYVQLLRARDFSKRDDFADALPMWQALSTAPAGLPLDEILLEKARAHFELKQWLLATEAYGVYLEKFPIPPASQHTPQSSLQIAALGRKAVALQNAVQYDAALTAWNDVRTAALDGSPELQTALEQSALLQASLHLPAAAATYRELLAKFPQTQLHALAAFTVGDAAYGQKKWVEAKPWLLDARQTDPATYQLPATQRLAWLSYELKDREATAGFVADYENATKNDSKIPRLPTTFYYWLGDGYLKQENFSLAAGNLEKVTRDPTAGNLLSPAWWSLAHAQAMLGQWDSSIASYETFQQLNPSQANATPVLLVLATSHLGQGTFDAAEKLINQALIQDPEGPQNAEARNLLGKVAMGRKNYPAAAKAFSALALLYHDPFITPRAMQHAAEAYALAGDQISAAEWRTKLLQQYPDYKPDSR